MHKLIETTFKGLFKGYNQGALAENKAQINEAECLKMLSDIIEIQQFKLQIESFDRWIAKQSVLKWMNPILVQQNGSKSKKFLIAEVRN
jgi:uncharacterized protein YbcC (UPF0753/DUF2309 family)